MNPPEVHALCVCGFVCAKQGRRHRIVVVTEYNYGGGRKETRVGITSTFKGPYV